MLCFSLALILIYQSEEVRLFSRAKELLKSPGKIINFPTHPLSSWTTHINHSNGLFFSHRDVVTIHVCSALRKRFCHRWVNSALKALPFIFRKTFEVRRVQLTIPVLHVFCYWSSLIISCAFVRKPRHQLPNSQFMFKLSGHMVSF